MVLKHKIQNKIQKLILGVDIELHKYTNQLTPYLEMFDKFVVLLDIPVLFNTTNLHLKYIKINYII